MRSPLLPVTLMALASGLVGAADPLETARTRLDEARSALDAAIAARAASASAGEADERLATVEADIEELVAVQERLVTQAGGDRLAWTASYRVTHNNILYEAGAREGSATNIWNHRLRLNLHARRGPLRLHARAAVYKSFGESWEGPVGDARSTRYPRDTSLRLERFYVDWFPHRRVAITVGRVASPGGPPAELKENAPRQATWGLQMVEAEFETLMTTVNLAPELPGSTLRLFYSPFFHHAAPDPADDDSLFASDGTAPTHIWGLMLERTLGPRESGSLLQLGFVHVPAFRPEAAPVRGPDGAPMHPTALPESLGQYLMANGLVEVKGIAGVLDVFVAGSVTGFGPKGVVEYPTGERLGLATMGEDSRWAAMAYAGGRYALPLGPPRPKVGLELNWGSKHHAHWGSPSDTLINKLATRGLAVEGYWVQPLADEGLFARLGVIHQRRAWRGGFVGPSVSADDTITNLYALMNAAF